MRSKISKVYVNDADEFRRILDVVKKYDKVVFGSWEDNSDVHSLGVCAFVDDKQINCSVSTKTYEWASGKSDKFTPKQYIFRKDGKKEQVLDPETAYTTLQHYYKAPDMKDFKINGKLLELSAKGSYVNSARPLVGFNPKYNNTEQRMWVYDLNSAYAAAMRGRMPDTEHPLTTTGGIVMDGYIGFMDDYECTMVKKGSYADVIFPLMESPYVKFAEKYYDMKKHARNPEEKAYAKQMLVYSVGYLQRHNPFLRATIVHKCNNYIKSLIDDNTAMWNTDAIYSLVPRTDLKIGDKLGEFKLEHDGVLIRHRGCNYQIVGGGVTYRGVSKNWFKEDWNLLTDDLPTEGNIYQLNHETLELEEINYEI